MVNVSPSLSLQNSSPANITYYNIDGNSREVDTLSVSSGTSSSGHGTCAVETKQASYNISGKTLTITIPQTIKCGNRFGTTNGPTFDRSIVVSFTFN